MTEMEIIAAGCGVFGFLMVVTLAVREVILKIIAVSRHEPEEPSPM